LYPGQLGDETIVSGEKYADSDGQTCGVAGFEVPAIIGLPGRIQVLTSKIYVALARTPKDEGTAGALATLFIVLSIAGILLCRRLTTRADVIASAG
jgi:iron(III) transport system permease protein